MSLRENLKWLVDASTDQRWACWYRAYFRHSAKMILDSGVVLRL